MRRWLGFGVVLAVLVASLGYVFSKQGGLASGSEGRGARTEGDSTARSLPVSALLAAPLPSSRGSSFIRGTVLGLDGRPMAGAMVVATAPTRDETLSELSCPCDDERGKKLPQCGCAQGILQLVERVVEREGEAPPHARTTSDAEGRFSLEGLEAGSYALWADGSFGTVLRENVPAGSEGIELWGVPGMTLSGRIHDEDGNVVAGALVTALPDGPSRFFDTLSDARGNWRIGPLPVGRYHLVVTHAGFLPGHESVDESSELEVTLYRPLRLTGQVLLEGRPVAGARVLAEGKKHQRHTSTDAEGRFTLEDLGPGTYQVIATHAGLDAVRRASLEPGREPRDVLFELGTDARVTGTVRDPAGHPIAGARVWVRLSSESGNDDREDAHTASDGTYTLGPLPLGRYHLFAAAPQYHASSHIVNVSAEEPNYQDFTIDPSLLIEGRVLNAAGQPLSGVRLELEEEATGEDRRSWKDSTFSGKDGTFVLEALRPVNHHLRAHHDDFLPTAQTAVAPSSGVQLMLRAGARVEGEVVDEKEVPVPLAQVLLQPAEDAHGYGFETPEVTLTDERGRFTLQGLVPGDHFVTVSSEAGGEIRQHIRPIEVKETEPVKVRLQLPEGLTLSGLVVDGAGNPVPGADVTLVPDELEDPEQEMLYRRRQREPRTGADGRFQVRYLAAGRYLLRASAKGHDFDPVANGLDGKEDGFQGVKAVAGATDVRIVLNKRARLRGRVVRPDGTPVTRFEINQKQVVDPQGAFALPIERSSEERLVFTAPNLAGTTREVVLKEGVDTELGEVVLTAGREVRGRVVDAVSGAPVAGAEVRVDDDPRDLELSLRSRVGEVRTAHDGTFTLTHVEESPLTLGVGHPDYKQTLMALAPRQAEVAVALETGATLQGEVYLSSGFGFEVVAWSPPSFSRRARVVGNEYVIRGLPAGTYAVIVRTKRPTHARNVDVPPRQVEIPASGLVVLDFAQSPAEVTLRLRWSGTPVPMAGYYLVEGSIPLPDSPRAVERLRELVFAMGNSNAGIFHRLPEGHYTLLVQALVNGEPHWHREELDLAGEGEVSHDLSPRWVRVPGLKE
ncbi:carboxypeptidase-like regulatory domain-containing protein [Archangium lansingense]|uniref:Carboxypeptidase-like regulatory domain-containing protein n=1 Tax=Archangium lansingense TaxID=2995310 RepID=A0ABT4A8R2_9BACT|nr:carboxypeptidase-like regulatory domain-containing protein [Archangium lansinium]MCY1078042.1 carboxypeptidase-like regulatory domain-containing protein [Archangium lansinium]